MANLANLIFAHTFTGSLDDEWPGFTWPTGNPPFSHPRIGAGGTANMGIGSLQMGAGTWRGRSVYYPGRGDYKADLTAKWKNPAGAGDRDVGLIVRYKDASNYLVARVSSSGPSGAGNRLRLYKVQGGTATQLGATWAGFSSAAMLTGITWRVRVAELTDGSGNTSVKVYSDSLGANGDGDLRIDYSGDLSYLRGWHTVGVELGSLVYNDDVAVDDLEVYDFGDEWVPDSPTATGDGWQVEIDGTLYDVSPDTGALDGLTPPVHLEWVRQGYGPNGNAAFLTESGDFTTGTVKPNSLVKVWHDGTLRFRGRVMRGSQRAAANGEQRAWTAVDAFALARNVILAEDDNTGVLTFNAPTDSDEYNPDRVDMTIGDVLEFLFARYALRLREVGAAPEDGSVAYQSGETALLTAVVPTVSVSNNFATAVAQLTALMPSFQVWVDPDDLVWHFRDVTALTSEAIALGSEWVVNVVASPDPSRSFSRVRYRGAVPEPASETVYTFGPEDQAGYSSFGKPETGGPTWTRDQAANYTKDKATRSHLTVSIAIAGLASSNPADPNYDPNAPKNTLVYVDILAKDGVDPDDFRGAVAAFSGDAYNRWCLGHTSTRFYFGSPLWGGGTPPSPGSTMTLSLVDPDAVWWLSAQGVGRAFFLPPVSICGGSPLLKGLTHSGFCGTATVSFKDGEGMTYSQEMQAKVHFASAAASGGGLDCGAAMVLAEKPKPQIGLINKLPPAGSPPNTWCEPGNRNDPAQGGITVDFSVSEHQGEAPVIYVPGEDTWEGCAYDTWGIEQEYVFDDPNFTHTDMAAGLTPAAQAILDVLGDCVFAFEATLATPWVAQAPQVSPVIDSVARWAGLFKAIRLSSSQRTTGFEASDFPTSEVVWNIRERTTTVKGGTALGWMGYDAQTLTRELRQAAIDKRIGQVLRTLEDYRNKQLAKNMKVGPSAAGPGDACDVFAVDETNRRVVTVNKKLNDDQKVVAKTTAAVKAINDLLLGESSVAPGDTQGAPGAAGGLVVPGVGNALGTPGRFDLAHQGIPDDVPNAARSRFGGFTGADDTSFGSPSRLITKRGGLAFRTEHDANGNVKGVEAAPLNADGSVPSAGYVRVERPADLRSIGTGFNPIDLPHADSITGAIRRRTDDLMGQLGNVRDTLGDLLAPGSVDADHPDGAPPSLASFLRTPGADRFFSMVPETWGDPLGPVWHGPKNGNGANAQMWWRVMAPENVLVQVEWTGTEWDWVDNGDGTLNFIRDGYVVHKQLHGNDFEYDRTKANPPEMPDPTEDDLAFGFSGYSWRLPANSGLGGTLALPRGVVGTPAVSAHLREDFLGAVELAGLTHMVLIETAYQGSAWTAPSPTPGGPGTAVTTDGASTGQGQFLAPADAVPPGLRSPGGRIAVSVSNTGSGTSGKAPILVGIGVELAVIDGGLLLRIKEEATVADEAGLNHLWTPEVAGVADEVSIRVGVASSEGVAVYDGVSVEVP